jgi:hypothetical protein
MQMLDPIVPPSQLRPDLGITADAEAVVMKALAKKRDTRYQTMGELLAALDGLAKTVMGPPTGQSATGSPIYQLSPLPPGASESTVMKAVGAELKAAAQMSAVIPSQTGAPPPSMTSQPTSEHTPAQPPTIETPTSPPPPRSSTPSSPPPPQRRLKDEPQFVTSARPAQFMLSDPEPVAQPDAHKPRYAMTVLTLIALAAVTTAAVTVILNNRGGGGSNAVAPKLDAGPLAAAPADAASVPVPVPGDASVVVVADVDAAVAIALPYVDAGVRDRHPHGHHDAGVAARDASGPVLSPLDPVNHRGTFAITVMTKPDSANLYVGTTYRGVSGTQLEEPVGTRYDVECRSAGYKPGHVSLYFDGRTSAVLCSLTRVKICIDNIKNPFDDCEIDPNRPSPDHSMP